MSEANPFGEFAKQSRDAQEQLARPIAPLLTTWRHAAVDRSVAGSLPEMTFERVDEIQRKYARIEATVKFATF